MYDLHDIVENEKTSRLSDEPLGSHSNGRSIKIRCMNCGHIVMMTRRDFEKKLKKVIEKMQRKSE